MRGVLSGSTNFIRPPDGIMTLPDRTNEKSLFNEACRSSVMRMRLGSSLRAVPRRRRKKGRKTGLDPALVERLKSLGYVAVAGVPLGRRRRTERRRLADPKDRIRCRTRFRCTRDSKRHYAEVDPEAAAGGKS